MKRLTQNIIIICVAIVISLMAAEVFLRHLFPTPFQQRQFIPPLKKFFQYDPYLGWVGISNIKGVFQNSDFDVEVRHDSNGFRNAINTFSEESDSIYILGDSYGWGWGVEDNEVVSYRLATMYPQYNFYNLSLPGYGSDQQYLALKQALSLDYVPSPRGVVLLFYGNDFDDVLHSVRYGYHKPRFVIDEGSLVLEPAPSFNSGSRVFEHDEKFTSNEPDIFNKSHVYNLVTRMGNKDNFSRLIRNTSFNWSEDKIELKGDENIDTSVLLLEKINQECAGEGLFFHVVLLKPLSTTRLWQRKFVLLEDALQKHDIDYSVFRSRMLPATDLWLDGHYSARGHQQLAEHIVGFVGREL